MSGRPRRTLLSLKPSGPSTGNPGPAPTPPPTRRPWFVRPWVLLLAVVVLGGGAAVLVDLPHHTTKVARVKEAAAVVDSIDSSIHECAYAVAQAFAFYHEDRAGTLSTSERAQLPGLVNDDAKACSFANTSVALLGTDIFGTLTLSSTPAARDLTAMVDSVLDWEATDALAAVEDIRSLIAHPGDAAAAAALAVRERDLAKDRAAADADIQRARRELGTSHVPYPALPRLPQP